MRCRSRLHGFTASRLHGFTASIGGSGVLLYCRDLATVFAFASPLSNLRHMPNPHVLHPDTHTGWWRTATSPTTFRWPRAPPRGCWGCPHRWLPRCCTCSTYPYGVAGVGQPLACGAGRSAWKSVAGPTKTAAKDVLRAGEYSVTRCRCWFQLRMPMFAWVEVHSGLLAIGALTACVDCIL